MTNKGLSTTVQESKGKFTTPIPMGLINLLGIKKSDTFIWNLDNSKIIITVVKAQLKAWLRYNDMLAI